VTVANFDLLKKMQQNTIEEISMFSNSSHLEWRAGMLDNIVIGDDPSQM